MTFSLWNPPLHEALMHFSIYAVANGDHRTTSLRFLLALCCRYRSFHPKHHFLSGYYFEVVIVDEFDFYPELIVSCIRCAFLCGVSFKELPHRTPSWRKSSPLAWNVAQLSATDVSPTSQPLTLSSSNFPWLGRWKDARCLWIGLESSGRLFWFAESSHQKDA